MSYREETLQVLQMMLERLRMQEVPSSFLNLVEQLISQGQIHDIQAIMNLMEQKDIQEGEDER